MMTIKRILLVVSLVCTVSMVVPFCAFASDEQGSPEVVGYAYLVEDPDKSAYPSAQYTLSIEAQKRPENVSDRYSYYGEVPDVAESADDLPWNGIMATKVSHVVIGEGVAPKSMAHWFEWTDLYSWTHTFSVDMSKMDASGVEDISYMFTNSDVRSVVFPESGMPSLRSMDLAFAGAWILRNVTGLDSLNATGVKTANKAFCGCSHLASLEIGGLIVGNGCDCDSMFAGCRSLRELDLSRSDFSGAAQISSMFDGCRALSDLDLSGGFGTESVTEGQDVFRGCNSLQRIVLTRGCVLPDWIDGDIGWVPVDSQYAAVENVELKNVEDVRGYLHSANDKVTLVRSAIVGNPIKAYLDCRDPSYERVLVIRTGDADTDGMEYLGFVSPGVMPLASIDDWVMGIRFENDVRPLSTASWFSSLMDAVRKVEGLEYLDTSSVTDMSNMFAGASNVAKHFDFSSFDTSNVTNMSGMFSGCESLRELDLSSFDTGKVVSHADMFAGCSRLATVRVGEHFGFADSEEIELPEGEWTRESDGAVFVDNVPAHVAATYTRQIEEGGSQGQETETPLYSALIDDSLIIGPDETALSSIEGAEVHAFPSDSAAIADKVKVVRFEGGVAPTSTSQWFSGWDFLEHVDFSGVDLSQVVEMYSMFKGCKSLKEVDFSNAGAISPTDIGRMFYGCSALLSLDLSTCDFSVCDFLHSHFLTTPEELFKGCDALRIVKVGQHTLAGSVALPSGMWRASSDDMVYRAYEVPDDKADVYERVAATASSFAQIDSDGLMTVAKTASELPDPNGDWYYISESGYASADDVPRRHERENIKAVNVISAGGVVDVSYWFADCPNLSVVDLSGLQSCTVCGAMGLFAGCSSLKNAELACLHIEDLRDEYDRMWGSTEKAWGDADLSGLFDGCSSLQGVTLPDLSQVTSVARMFRCCSALESIDLNGINISNAVDFSEMFRYCISLHELDLSTFDTRKAKAMRAMFHGCKALEQIKLGDKFTFRGGGQLRLAGSEFPDGAWIPASGDGSMAYASDSIPCADNGTYTRLPDDATGVEVKTIYEDRSRGDDLYVETAALVDDGEGGTEVELSYEVPEESNIGSLTVGDSTKASSYSWINSRTVSKTTLANVWGNVNEVVIGPNVNKIKKKAFSRAPQVSVIYVQSKKLTKKSKVNQCLRGSNVRNAWVSTGSYRKDQKVIKAFNAWAW